MLQSIKYLFDLFVSKKDSFLLLGICVLPLFSIFRLIIKPFLEHDPFLLTLLTIFFLSLQLYFFYSLLFQESLAKKMFSFFVFLINTKFIQQVLFFLLLLEQLVKLHFIVWMIFVFSVTSFFIILYQQDFILILQLVFVFFGVYIRFRQKILGKDFLLVTGMNENQPVSWKEFMDGMNAQMVQIKARIDSTPKDRESKDLSSLSVGPAGVGSAGLIQNRWTNRNDITFPFFFGQARRNISFRSAAKTLYETLLNTFQRAPLETGGAVITVVGTTSAGVYTVIRDQQKHAIEIKKIEQTFEHFEMENKNFELENKNFIVRSLESSMKMTERELERRKKTKDECYDEYKLEPSENNLKEFLDAKTKLEEIEQEINIKRLDFGLTVQKNVELSDIYGKKVEIYKQKKQLLENKIPTVFEKKNVLLEQNKDGVFHWVDFI